MPRMPSLVLMSDSWHSSQVPVWRSRLGFTIQRAPNAIPINPFLIARLDRKERWRALPRYYSEWPWNMDKPDAPPRRAFLPRLCRDPVDGLRAQRRAEIRRRLFQK